MKGVGFAHGVKHGGMGLRLGLSLLAFSVALAACGSDDSGSAESEDDTFTLGISNSDTGVAAVYSDVGAGFAAYFEYLAAEGGIEGLEIKTETVDNASTVAGGASSARRLLAQDPLALLMVTTPAFTGAAASIEQQSPEMPVLAIANGEAVAQAELRSAFGMLGDYTVESLYLGQYLYEELSKSSIGLVYNPIVNPGSARELPDFVDKLGGNLVASIAVPPETTNYAPVVQELQESNADAVILVVGIPAVAGIMKAAERVGLDVPFVTNSPNLDPSLIELGGGSVEGLYVSALFPSVEADTPAMREFRTGIETVDSGLKNSLGLYGWNAGAIVAEALRNVVDAGPDVTREALTDALVDLGGKSAGVLEELGWTPTSHAALDGGDPSLYFMQQLNDGEYGSVS